MIRILRIFRPEVQVTLKVVFLIGLTSAYLATFAWGYGARQEARRWRDLACTYRLSELQRAVPGQPGTGPACDTLQRVGISVARLSR